MVLPEIISKEPLGPVVRHGDSKWEDLVRWSLNAMIVAVELGVTSSNVDDMKVPTTPKSNVCLAWKKSSARIWVSAMTGLTTLSNKSATTVNPLSAMSV